MQRLTTIMCSWLSKHLTSDTIMVGGEPYLTRYYLWGHGKELGFGKFGIPDFLHLFHVSDYDCLADVVDSFDNEEDRKKANDNMLLHNHPWEGTSYSFILTTGYTEERCKADCQITQRLCLPWSFNVIHDDDFHRVDLLGEGVWTLFFTGGRSGENNWCFLDRETGIQYDWRLKKGAIA